MPELPDIVLYCEALEKRIPGQALKRIRITNPFFLRSVHPAVESLYGQKVIAIRRVGKRIAIQLESRVLLVLHLMIAGRLHWHSTAPKLKGKQNLAAFDFSSGSLLITEAGSKHRASLRAIPDETSLAALNPGGVEVLECTFEQFETALKRENHTLKRSLTDPRILSGIGNAYSDEILHRAGLSPILLTQKASETDFRQLFDATREVLSEWTERLRQQTGENFPEKVTAFRPEMAVHGKFGKPCPVCGTKIQRIRYADNETNYCPKCQTKGTLLADRSLSLLLRKDWPRTAEELEEKKAQKLF